GWFCDNEMTAVLPKRAFASPSTGQPLLMLPVSTFSAKMRCFLVVPLYGVVIASRNSVPDGRSTTGVLVMPSGLMSAHGRLVSGTGAPTFLCQMTLPLAASSAY